MFKHKKVAVKKATSRDFTAPNRDNAASLYWCREQRGRGRTKISFSNPRIIPPLVSKGMFFCAEFVTRGKSFKNPQQQFICPVFLYIHTALVKII
jgi:hypothetical protein